MEEFKYKVYVQVNSSNVINEIQSNLKQDIDFSQWTQIDEGTGDKYAHAQGNYFTIDGKKPLVDEKFRNNYKLVDGKPVELTEEEKEKLFPVKAQEPTQEDVLWAKIIKDGVAMQLQLVQQQKINANLLSQIANLTTQISKLGGTQ